MVIISMTLAASFVLAQASSGSLHGQVTDPSGAAITNANVVMTPATGAPITVQSNGQGMYEFKGLAPGTYTLNVVADGFNLFENDNVQLTAQAIRSVQEARETEALGSLQRAEELLARVHDEALPPKRREEVDRRLWWGYNRLGARRVESGEFEDAIEPLFRALRLAPVGTERHAETRAALVRAFEGLVDARALEIRQRADDGDREAAVVETDRLWARLTGARARGREEHDLAVASAMVRRLFDELGLTRE